MLNPNINYPYPIIRTYVGDYKTTVFTGDLKVNIDPKGYLVRPDFNINNLGIEDLISVGTLTYAVEVQSPATWYRRLFPIKDNKSILLEPSCLHERVELTPCIVAAAEITGFTNSDFDDDYNGMSFDISAGDVIAIGEIKTFDALYKNDIIKSGSSIVNVNGSTDTKEIICDFSGNIIDITLPADQFEAYTNCGAMKTKYKTLNAILVIPALVEAITYIAADVNAPDRPSGFESKAWYKTIVVNLKRAAENKENKYRQLLEKPFASAELLLGNNYIAALEFVDQIG